MFFALFLTTLAFVASPFLRHFGRRGALGAKDRRLREPVYMAQMVSRFLSVLVISQSLRIVSFLSTSLPGPNYHCRPDSLTYDPPKGIYDIFLRQDAFLGCGDLVFSSHTTFVLLCALTVQKYSNQVTLKRGMWLSAVIFTILCVAARKHYTLDIVVACYTVPLVWVAFDTYFPDKVPHALRLLEQRHAEEALVGSRTSCIAVGDNNV